MFMPAPTWYQIAVYAGIDGTWNALANYGTIGI
jgi:hypothetical protein